MTYVADRVQRFVGTRCCERYYWPARFWLLLKILVVVFLFGISVVILRVIIIIALAVILVLVVFFIFVLFFSFGKVLFEVPLHCCPAFLLPFFFPFLLGLA